MALQGLAPACSAIAAGERRLEEMLAKLQPVLADRMRQALGDVPLRAVTGLGQVFQRIEHEAERQDRLRQLRQELSADLAELRRLERALDRTKETLLPLADEKVRLTMADYRSGKGELTAVITAREELLEMRLRLVDLASNRSLTNARLHFSLGDTQP